MRVIVSRPVDGRTDIRLDDRYGITGLNVRRLGVSIEEAPAVAGELAELWHARRRAIFAAKKPASP